MMTEDQMNDALFKLCGWQEGYWAEFAATCGGDVKNGQIWMQGKYTDINGKVHDKKPNFCKDLNAMWIAEEQVCGDDIDEWLRYDCLIAEITPGWTFHAKAKEKAEALLRLKKLYHD